MRNQINSFDTILIAPEIYHNGELKGFDYRVNYEDILNYFMNNKEIGNRREYKTLLIKSAIEKGTHGYQIIKDDSVSLFWRDYWKLTISVAKEFNMEEPTLKPSSASFIYFRDTFLPKDIDLVHKLTHGYFDLQFKGMGDNLNIMRDKYGKYLTDDMRIEKANKSASIRIKVPKLSLADSVESQKEKLMYCIKVGNLLLNWYKNLK